MPHTRRESSVKLVLTEQTYTDFEGDIYSSSISGRAILADGREFSCSATSVSASEAKITADVATTLQQIIACYLDGVGMILGKVVKVTETGFVLSLVLPEERRNQIIVRLEWHQRRVAKASELRGSPRIVPLYRNVEIRLGEHIILHGTISNISRSGAYIALGLPSRPFVGARVRVGSRDASVVRLTQDGIAVQFTEPFLADGFNELVRP